MSIFYKQFRSMGTRMDLVLPDSDQLINERVAALAGMELRRIEHLLSVYDPESEVSFINNAAGNDWVAIGKELSDILHEISRYHTLTNGYFDITIKPVLDRILEGVEGRPEELNTDAFVSVIGMDKLILEKDRIRFKNKGMALDLGGFGKGYAVRSLVNIFRDNGVSNALISFGESLIYGHGHHPHGDCWKISIPVSMPDPQQDNTFELTDEAISTSGNTFNNQKKFGHSGHIFDPLRFRFRTEFGSVSIKASDPVTAEVLSTACFGAGKDGSERLIRNMGNIQHFWSFEGTVGN